MNKLHWMLFCTVLLIPSLEAREPDIIYVNGKPVYIEGVDLPGAPLTKDMKPVTKTTPVQTQQPKTALPVGDESIYRGHVLGESTEERNTQYGEIYRGTVFGKEAPTGYAGETLYSKEPSKTKLLYDTSLIHAIKINDADRVRTLIYANVDVNERNYAGMTPLTIAAEKGNYAIVRLLIQEGGANVNDVSSYGITPLIAAVAGGNRETVELLLQNGADTAARDDLGRTALIHAMAVNDPHLVETLVKNNHATINIPDNAGNTPLIYAAQKGDTQNVRTLLKNNADPNYQNPTTGVSALIAAISNGKNKAADALFYAPDINLDLNDKSGRTALFYAAQTGQTNLVRRLLRKGAYANVLDTNKENALMAAAQEDHLAIVKILTPQYLSMETTDQDGKNALMYSTAAKGTHVLQWLINQKIDLNTRDKNGNTALMHALKNNNKAAASLLLKQDVDLTATNRQKQDAFSLAQEIMPQSNVNALLQQKREAELAKQQVNQTVIVQEWTQQPAGEAPSSSDSADQQVVNQDAQ